MMSGLRSQREKTITCVSERSGIASSGIFLIVQLAAASATAVKISTRNLLRALNSMIRSIIGAASVGVRRRRLRAERFQRCTKARLGIDQEVGRGDDLLAGFHAGKDLVVSLRVAPELDGTRFEPPAVAD